MIKRSYPHPELRMDRTDFDVVLMSKGQILNVRVAKHAYFYAIRDGHGTMIVQGADGKSFDLHAGDIIITSGFSDHALYAGAPSQTDDDAPGMELVQAHVPVEAIAFMPFGGGAMKLNSSEDQSILPHIWRAVDSILAEYREDPAPLWTADIVRRLWEIVVINISRAIAQNHWFVPGALLDERIIRAIAIASRDLAHEWTVSELAAEAGMSRTAFASRYRDMLSDTPLRGLTRMRVHQAAALLQQGSESVDNVARRVGYATATPFIRAFAKEFGQTPSRWRRQIRTGGPVRTERVVDA